MRALVLNGPNDFGVREIPKPTLESGDVLLRVAACSLCGTDTRILDGSKTRGVRYPSVIGHEIAGFVAAVDGEARAADGDPLSVDQLVALSPVIPCHRCRYCIEGRENACANGEALGYDYDGGFAEYMRVPASAVRGGQLFRLPEGFDPAAAAVAEPLACCLNGIRKTEVGIGDRCLVFGAGPIGLMHVALCRAAGAELVIVSEPKPGRRAMAMRFGADAAIDPTSVDVPSEVRRLTAGDGIDVIIAAIGVPSLVNQALKLLRKGGRLNLFAGFPDKGEAVIEANLIHYNETIVTGTSAATRLDYRTALGLIVSRRVDAAALVSHRFPLDGFGKALDLHRRGEGLKVVIEP